MATEKTCRHCYGLFILRLMIGSTFIMHGGEKMLKLVSADGLTQFVSWLGTLGVPSFFAYCVPFCEFFGGIMILLGIATEIGALLIVPVMAGAVLLVHLKGGYFLPKGFEYAFNLLLGCLALIAAGPGTWFLWDPITPWFKRKR